MVDKKEAAPGWPIITGEYSIGDPSKCVSVVTLGSHLDETPILEAGASLVGPCKTENLGIEKVIANIVSNPNIRFLIVAGSEVKGHLTGESILCIHQYGVKDGRIINTTGAIPYIENVTEEVIARFQKQVECIDMIGNEDLNAIIAKVKEYDAKDPGAIDEDPIVVEIEGGGEEGDESAGAKPLASEVAIIQSRIKNIESAMIEAGNMNKYHSGVHAGKVEGIMIGLIITLGLLGLLVAGGI